MSCMAGTDGRSFGALSHTIVRTVSRHKRKYGDKPITNHELVLKVEVWRACDVLYCDLFQVRQLLNKSGFEQNPCLECSVKNATVNFIVW